MFPSCRRHRVLTVVPASAVCTLIGVSSRGKKSRAISVRTAVGRSVQRVGSSEFDRK